METSILASALHHVSGPVLPQIRRERDIGPLTCVLYSPRLCELRVRGDRLPLADGHIFDQGHARRVDVGTLKVIVGTDGCL